MVGEFFSWYVTSLGEFWSSAIRIGLPQILLAVLLICWLRRKSCGKSSDKSCCWNWSWGFGSSGDESGSSCCASEGCGCTCGNCCCQAASHDDGGDGGDGADHDHE